MIAAALTWIRANKALAAAAVILLLVLAAWGVALWLLHAGEKAEAARRDAQAAQAITGAVQDDAAIKAALDVARRASDAQLAAANRTLKEADDHEADNRPSPARVAYLCGVLRSQAAAGLSDLPARCRPAVDAGARRSR